MAKSAILNVQRWGNSLAVRIPAAVARSARFRVGQPIEVSAKNSRVLVKAIGDPRLSRRSWPHSIRRFTAVRPWRIALSAERLSNGLAEILVSRPDMIWN